MLYVAALLSDTKPWPHVDCASRLRRPSWLDPSCVATCHGLEIGPAFTLSGSQKLHCESSPPVQNAGVNAAVYVQRHKESRAQGCAEQGAPVFNKQCRKDRTGRRHWSTVHLARIKVGWTGAAHAGGVQGSRAGRRRRPASGRSWMDFICLVRVKGRVDAHEHGSADGCDAAFMRRAQQALQPARMSPVCMQFGARLWRAVARKSLSQPSRQRHCATAAVLLNSQDSCQKQRWLLRVTSYTCREGLSGGQPSRRCIRVMWHGACSAEVGVSGPGCAPKAAGSERLPFRAATGCRGPAPLGVAPAAAGRLQGCWDSGGQQACCCCCAGPVLSGCRSKPMPLLRARRSSREGTSGRPHCM